MSANQDKFLESIESGENAKQAEAWKQATKQEVSVIPVLADLMFADNPSVAKAASECLKKLIHSTGKVKGNAKRAAAANQLLLLLEKNDKRIATFALRHLSLIADEDSIPYIKKYILDKELHEEGVFCVERIPGDASIAALIQALKRAPDEFKARIMAALGHRKAEAATDVIAGIMSSSTDVELVLAAVKAIGRIGAFPEAEPQLDFDSLTDRQKGVLFDSILRIVDASIAKGNVEQAGEMMGWMFGGEEEIPEHYVCGAIVSASKIDDPKAVEAIAERLTHVNYVVRDTAEKALLSMKADTVIPVLKGLAGQADGDRKKALEAILKAR